MIVCSCNVISDHQVRSVAAERAARGTSEVYRCLGCSAECGRCARTIKTIIDEALGPCVMACNANCPHSHRAHQAETLQTEFALAAS